jgi:hypothetical protein
VTTNFTYRGDGLRNSRQTGMTTTTFTSDVASGLPVVIDDGNQYVYGATGLGSMKQAGDRPAAQMFATHGDPGYHASTGLHTQMPVICCVPAKKMRGWSIRHAHCCGRRRAMG